MSASSQDEMSDTQSAHQAQNVPPAMERAEVLVDQLGTRLGHWTSALGDTLQRFWARTREEGEDIWAEANDIRDRNQVGVPPSDRVEHAPQPKSAKRRSRTTRMRTSAAGAESSNEDDSGS